MINVLLFSIYLLLKVHFVMKILLTQFSAYHMWANQLLFSTINKLSPELQTMQVASSFPSLTETVKHMWNAENIWWQRMKLNEQIKAPGDFFQGDFNELSNLLMNQSKQWHEWILISQQHMLDHQFIYYNTKKEKFKQSIYQALIHIFNHGTYHRGQLVTILRQLEITNIPATDFIVWSRK